MQFSPSSRYFIIFKPNYFSKDHVFKNPHTYSLLNVTDEVNTPIQKS
jgi:hypothetical protein